MKLEKDYKLTYKEENYYTNSQKAHPEADVHHLSLVLCFL